MNKPSKRLSLRSETVAILAGKQLHDIRGGVITDQTYQCDTWTNPDPSGNTCGCGPNTFEATCPTVTSCACTNGPFTCSRLCIPLP